MPESVTLHATCVSVGGRGVLLLGPPGAGKSSLALRLIDQPGTGISATLRAAELVADDQVTVRRAGIRLLAYAPPAIAGKLEIRGLGIVDVPAIPEVALSLAVKLSRSENIERLPCPHRQRYSLLEVMLPMVEIDPEKAAAPARIRAALDLW